MASPTLVWDVSHADLVHANVTSGPPTWTSVRAPMSGLSLTDGDYLLACTFRPQGGAEDLVPPTGWELVHRQRVQVGIVYWTLEVWGHTVALPLPATPLEDPTWYLYTHNTTVQLVGVGYRGVYAPDPVHKISANYGYGTGWNAPTIVPASDDTQAVLFRLATESPSFTGSTGLTEQASDPHSNYFQAFDKAVASAGSVGGWAQTAASAAVYQQILLAVASVAPPPFVYHKRGSIALL